MNSPTLQIELDESTNCIRISGALDLAHFNRAHELLQHVRQGRTMAASVDASQLTRLDTAGALLLLQLPEPVARQDMRPEHLALLDLVDRTETGELSLQRKQLSFVGMITRLGRATMAALTGARELIVFMGHACTALGHVIRHPKQLRLGAITHQIQAIGIEALPIIALIAFVISIVLAYQGQAQLRPLGVQQYTVNLIAISVLREMGVLLTAIMLAGRSGSAFTAQIGVMKLREEVDALRTIGFDPFTLLVVPRLLALLIVLPLLTFFADIMGLLGGALLSLTLLDISLPEYLVQVKQVATWNDFLVGMIKAPVFAIVIALVGCMHGFKVTGSAESVGRETTASVVKSIFLVLLIDGLFSVYFEQVGL